MSINPEDIKRRWEVIRDKESLALDPESVADYLKKPESDIVRERIQETLTQLALYRVKEDSFHSDKPEAPGDLATCEGLESFLIPAVEGALAFSTFLEEYKETEEEKGSFINALTKDVQALIGKWVNGVFSGKPYSDDTQIKRSLETKVRQQNETINITETAAMACRVLIHLLTLKLNRPEERVFQDKIGKALDDEKMLASLKTAIDFLIRAFQKGEGETLEEKVANARAGEDIGSGWSWTDWEGLPPMLFFTASAVDAFAELDLYLIRPAVGKDWKNPNSEQKKLLDFYNSNKDKLINLQLCVEMARRWVQSAALPYLSREYGLHPEEWRLEQDLGDYAIYADELKRKGFNHSPLVLYNSLYVLQILLWTWGDRNESGDGYDEGEKSRINRALAQLVYNYDNFQAVKEILKEFVYKFYLPGKKYFISPTDNKCEYLDSGFLPLLTRLLVLFVVYGVGDRNLLEPVIRNLYIELLQNRYRGSVKDSVLWSSDNIEIFSTQRAIQALTFYFAYARGKEKVTGEPGMGDGIVWRNKDGMMLVIEAITKGKAGDGAQQPVSEAVMKSTVDGSVPPPSLPENFIDYCHQLSPDKAPPLIVLDSPGGKDFIDGVEKQGDEILSSIKNGKIKDFGAAKLVLNSLWRIWMKPLEHEKLRELEFEFIKEQYEELLSGHPTA